MCFAIQIPTTTTTTTTTTTPLGVPGGPDICEEPMHGMAAHGWIPAKACDSSTPPPEGAPALAPTILCVDDHASLLASLQRALEHQGLNVLVASDATKALDVLRRTQVDAMIIDLKLRDMTGLTLIKTARLFGVDAPAIVYTAYPDESTKTEALELGVRYISKHDVRVRDLTGPLRSDIEADRALRASTKHEALRFLALASALEARQAVEPGWRDDVAQALARVLIDVTAPFASFLNAAEAFSALIGTDAAPHSVGMFMRLQAKRCYARGDIARKIELSVFVDSVERAGPAWQTLRSGALGTMAHADAEKDRALHAVGWSLDLIIRAAALRRAVMLVAHTQEQVAQIGYQLGFSQPTSFGRFFRSFLAVAPLEFRGLVRTR